MLSARPAALHAAAFLGTGTVDTTVDLAAHRAESTLNVSTSGTTTQPQTPPNQTAWPLRACHTREAAGHGPPSARTGCPARPIHLAGSTGP